MSSNRRTSFLSLSSPIEHSPVFAGDNEIMTTQNVDQAIAISTVNNQRRRNSSFSGAGPLSLSPGTTNSNQFRPRADSQDEAIIE